MVTARILCSGHCGELVVGYFAVEDCRDIWWLDTARIFGGRKLHGYSAVGHCRDIWLLGTVRCSDFKVDIVLAQLEPDFGDQLPSVLSVQPPSILLAHHQVSLQCPTAKCPCVQPQSIPAVSCSAQPSSIPAVSNHQVPCSVQPPSSAVSHHQQYHQVSLRPSIPAVSNQPNIPVFNHQVFLQCPISKYPGSVQPLSILAVPNRKISLQCPTIKYPCSKNGKKLSLRNDFSKLEPHPTIHNSRIAA